MGHGGDIRSRATRTSSRIWRTLLCAAATESLASSSFRRNTLLEAVFEVSRHTGYRRNCSVIWLGWAASGSVEILGNASTSVTIHTTTEASLLEVLSGSELALLS